MTYDAQILHVSPGRRHLDRYEVTLRTERHGRPFEIDAYLWVRNTRGELVASLLESAQHRQETLRLTTEETTWGDRIAWAEKIEVPA
jgi:hypothetical protein